MFKNSYGVYCRKAFLVPLLGAMGAIGLDVWSARSASKSAERTNVNQMALADKQMAFQKEAMQSQHQWEVKDLEKAGLNPILSAGGSGPGVSSGAQAQLRDPMENAANIYANSARKTGEISLNRALQKKLLAETKKTNVETENVKLHKERLKHLNSIEKSLIGSTAITSPKALLRLFREFIWPGRSAVRNMK